MHQEHDPGPLMGMCACDAQLFRRVWERVEQGNGTHSPVAPGPAGENEGQQNIAPADTAVSGADTARSGLAGEPLEASGPSVSGTEGVAVQTAVQPPEPAAPQEEGVTPEGGESGDTGGGDDFPPEDDLPCLGSGSAGQGSQLQTYIREELESWQLYRLLARRVNGPRARTLTALASEKHRCARRLAAAYFLISGVRYWPTDRLETPVLNAWLGVLRSRFALEQRREFRYRAAMCDTCDPCLRELYGELATDCARHAATVRALLESAL